MTSAERPWSSTTISVRLPAGTRELIDSAAALQGQSCSEFIVESARVRAVDVLLDQRVFNLDPYQSQAFAEALASPPKPHAALRALMVAKAPWE
jgi:uncharacterized protein (DUF1778 family)